MRGATLPVADIRAGKFISIHAPHAGSDLIGFHFVPSQGISIHAPHAGSDPVDPAGH